LAAKGQVNCHCCNGEAQKFGRFQNANRIVQRYRCVRCAKTFSETQPLDGLRVDFQKACQVVHLLCEGMGIRAIERFTGLNRETVLNILEVAGQKANSLLEQNIRDVKAAQVQADELISFVGMKEHNAEPDDLEHGNFFTYLSIDRASKLIINWRTAKRSKPETYAFLSELKNRVQAPFQLTTDGWVGYAGYTGSVKRIFGQTIDYAIETKRYAATSGYGASMVWHRRRRVVSCRRKAKIGNPDLKMATTSHCERTNLSVRIFNRRFTRLTLGYSKKLENLRHAVALFVWHFDFCRIHSAHKQTPAQAANLTNRVWKIEELFTSTN
jgi:transposase-like protein/IS1 family transposase